MPQMMPFFWLLSEIFICSILVSLICSNLQFFLLFSEKESELVPFEEGKVLWLVK